MRLIDKRFPLSALRQTIRFCNSRKSFKTGLRHHIPGPFALREIPNPASPQCAAPKRRALVMIMLSVVRFCICNAYSVRICRIKFDFYAIRREKKEQNPGPAVSSIQKCLYFPLDNLRLRDTLGNALCLERRLQIRTGGILLIF